MIFVELRDGSGEIQCVVYKGDVTDQVFNLSKNLTIETSIIIEGVIRHDERSKIGYEMSVSNLKIIHQPKEEFPISPKEHGTAFLQKKSSLVVALSKTGCNTKYSLNNN